MSYTTECPRCESLIEMEVVCDGDGDGIYTRTWESGEIVSQDCKCELTEEEEMKLSEWAVEYAKEDSYDFSYEPW